MKSREELDPQNDTGDPEASSSPSSWHQGIKLFITIGLIGYLAYSGSLDPTAILALAQEPHLALATITTWGTVSLLLGGIRYRFLLGATAIKIGILEAYRLQLVGLFFNTVLPGNVAGDLWKSLTVSREHQKARSHLILLLLAERGLGLSALFAGALMLSCTGGDFSLGPLNIAFLWLVAFMVGGPFLATFALIFTGTRHAVLRFIRVLPFASRLQSALAMLTANPSAFILAYLISIVMHVISIAYFWWIAQALPGSEITLAATAVAYSIGILSIILPVSIAGLGVGHAAFEGIFSVLGAKGGANVFNLYLIGQLTPNLAGAIPYLFRRSPKNNQDSPQV